jgi:hypothetical protein
MQSKKDIIASEMVTTVTASIGTHLQIDGLQAARDTWRVLNDTFSANEWWPPVARAVRELFRDYAAQQQQEKYPK